MVVDWCRECYASKWRLFRDQDITTPGRYYFSPSGSLHYPGWHNLGSRRWYDGNNTILQGLGEDLATRQTHQTGAFVGVLPESVYTGSPDCIANGETGDGANPEDLINGFPLACYIPPRPLPPPQPAPEPSTLFSRASQFDRCVVHRLWVRVIEMMLLDDEQGIQDLLGSFFGPGTTITYHGTPNNRPGCVTCINPEFSIACMSGRPEGQVLALEAFQGVLGPVDQGAYSTLPLWASAANYVQGLLNMAGADPTKPIFLVGHSYGGATALLVAANYRLGQPTRTIKYATYGAPKPGDIRLRDILFRVDGVSLANDNDFVTILPPDAEVTFPLVLLFPLFVFAPWYSWVRAPNFAMQDGDGNLFIAISPSLDYTTLVAMGTNVVLGLPQGPILGHSIDEYARRLALRCPDREWPVSEETWEEIIAPIGDAGGIVFSGGPGSFQGSGTILLGGGNLPSVENGGLLLDGGDFPPGNRGGLLLGG